LNVGVNFFGGVAQSTRTNLPLAGGIGGHDQAKVAMKKFLKFSQVGDATTHVFVNVEGMNDPEMLGGGGHQLHQPHSTLRGHNSRLPRGLNLNDCSHEGSRHSILLGIVGYAPFLVLAHVVLVSRECGNHRNGDA
jgi:hypothetical protein